MSRSARRFSLRLLPIPLQYQAFLASIKRNR
ncbi:hypothetical protein RLEG12_12310 [Rhizobium leguminosarum bv. trifolii CB782]|nr:hypothetical protein RLEG12_12310 [Rhizobium leguminosarum bv. trifolii CB782]